MSILPVIGDVNEDDWDRFKETIRKLYLDDNRKLEGPEGVRNEMRRYNFRQTKAQYERHFRSWGWRKNNNAKRWQLIATKVLKRKRAGKDSDVYLEGALLPAKKLRKEVQRYGKQNLLEDLTHGDNPQTPDSIVICTPRENQLLTYGVIFELPFLQYFRRFALNVIQGLEASERISPTLGTDAQTQPHEKLQVLRTSRSIVNLPSLAGFPSNDATLVGHDFCKNVLTDRTTEKQLATALNNRMELVQFLKSAIIAMSNNLLSPKSRAASKILAMLGSRTNDLLFLQLVAEEAPTADCLAEKLFSLALEAGSTTIVSALTERGVDVNIVKPSKDDDKNLTALGLACRSRNVELVKVLIAHGADINSREYVVLPGHRSPTVFSPLSLAIHSLSRFRDISSNDLQCIMELMQELLDGGAEANGYPGYHSPLTQLVELPPLPVIANSSADALRTRRPDLLHVMIKNLISAGAELDGKGLAEGPLDKAASLGDFETFKFLHQSGARPTGLTLYCAIKGKNEELIRTTMDLGVKEHCIEANQSCLVSAIMLHDKHLFSLILNSGLVNRSVDVLAKTGEAALGTQLQPFLSNLLEAGASNPTLLEKLQPAMDKAVFLKDFNTVALLLREGVPATAHTLRLAIAQQSEAIISLLFEADVAVNLSDRIPFRPVSYSFRPIAPIEEAVTIDSYPLVEELLRRGARLSGTDTLAEAVHGRSIPMINMLLAAGASANEYHPDAFMTPLRKAVSLGSVPIVQLLLDNGADVDGTMEYYEDREESVNTESPLYMAIEKNRHDLAHLLLDAGADVNYSNKYGMFTPLAAAANLDDDSMMEFLLQNGADPEDSVALFEVLLQHDEIRLQFILNKLASKSSLSNKRFKNQALCEAIQLDFEKAVDLLLQNGAEHSVEYGGIRINTAIKEAIDADKDFEDKYLTKLLETRPDLNCQIENFGSSLRCARTPLLQAIEIRSIPIMEYLIQHGANANLQASGETTRTPLQTACKVAYIDAVKLLLDLGADVNAPPGRFNGATALQFAAITGSVDIADLLLRGGADIDAPASLHNGRTALEGAAENGRIDMIGLLLQHDVLTEGPWEKQYLRALQLAEANGHFALKKYLESAVSQRRETLV